jgi:hypothetical protein
VVLRRDAAMTDTDAALAAIEDAFGSLQRPPNDRLLHEQCADDGDLLELYDVTSWQAMDDELVIRNYAAPAFLSPAGFRYFLPAFMSFALRNPRSPEVVVESTVWHLSPFGEADEFVRSKFTLFTPAQRRATRLFLEAMSDEHDTAAALEHWRG